SVLLGIGGTGRHRCRGDQRDAGGRDATGGAGAEAHLSPVVSPLSSSIVPPHGPDHRTRARDAPGTRTWGDLSPACGYPRRGRRKRPEDGPSTEQDTTMDHDGVHAVLFDLDGVITPTAEK